MFMWPLRIDLIHYFLNDYFQTLHHPPMPPTILLIIQQLSRLTFTFTHASQFSTYISLKDTLAIIGFGQTLINLLKNNLLVTYHLAYTVLGRDMLMSKADWVPSLTELIFQSWARLLCELMPVLFNCLTDYIKYCSLKQCIFIISQFLQVRNLGINQLGLLSQSFLPICNQNVSQGSSLI